MQPKRLPYKTVRTSANGRFWSVPISPVTHILAPTDLTADSRESVTCAVRLARRFDAKLTLLHICPGSERADMPFSPLYAGQLELDGRRVLEESYKAERTLRAMRDRIRVQHSLTEDCFLLGDPGSLILWVARESNVDLMVISTHYYNWLDGLFDEANTDKIIRDAPCCVLVVSPTDQEARQAVSDDSLLTARQRKTSGCGTTKDLGAGAIELVCMNRRSPALPHDDRNSSYSSQAGGIDARDG